MNGIEGLPFLVLVSLLALAIAVAGSFGFITKFMVSTNEANFREDVLGLWQSMNTLASAGDRGSFKAAFLKIPGGHSLVISIDNDMIIGVLPNSTFSFSAPGNITQAVTTVVNSNGTVTYTPGNYELRVFYGTPENFTKWMIVFQ